VSRVSGSFGTGEIVAKKKKLRSWGMIQLNIGSLFKLSGKIKYSEVASCNLDWATEVESWALPIF
jgi:hypothetical protein